jgi:hypothetical protein
MTHKKRFRRFRNTDGFEISCELIAPARRVANPAAGVPPLPGWLTCLGAATLMSRLFSAGTMRLMHLPIWRAKTGEGPVARLRQAWRVVAARLAVEMETRHPRER